jgi:hypothetical protein
VDRPVVLARRRRLVPLWDCPNHLDGSEKVRHGGRTERHRSAEPVTGSAVF